MEGAGDAGRVRLSSDSWGPAGLPSSTSCPWGPQPLSHTEDEDDPSPRVAVGVEVVLGLATGSAQHTERCVRRCLGCHCTMSHAPETSLPDGGTECVSLSRHWQWAYGGLLTLLTPPDPWLLQVTRLPCRSGSTGRPTTARQCGLMSALPLAASTKPRLPESFVNRA
jgi:hypothetical protein